MSTHRDWGQELTTSMGLSHCHMWIPVLSRTALTINDLHVPVSLRTTGPDIAIGVGLPCDVREGARVEVVGDEMIVAVEE